MKSRKRVLNILFCALAFGCVFFATKTVLIRKPKKQIDIIGVGFPRSGTTIFFNELAALPQVNRLQRFFDAEYKIVEDEVHFFGNLSKKSRVTLRKTDKAKKRVFKPAKKYYEHLLSANKINIEKSPQYIWDDSALEEISRFNPDVKIVVNLRKPVDWLYSYYKLCQPEGRGGITNDTSFENYLEMTHPESHIPVKETAIYSKFVESIYKHFPKENVHFVILEELDQVKTSKDLCALLDLPNNEDVISRTTFRKISSCRNKIGDDLYDELQEFYRPYNEELFKLIGRRIEEWQ